MVNPFFKNTGPHNINFLLKTVNLNNYNLPDDKISDIKEFPKNLSVEDILIRSSNVGTLLLARKVGEEKFIRYSTCTN